MKRLQSLSYKTLLTIFFFAVAGIVFILKFGFGNQAVQVSAAWWDDAWHYRKAISITNSSGSNLTDFQVSISIGTSQLIADGKMQNNCNDIRITDINGNLLPYWIEENNPGCNSPNGDTKIWIKASSLPTSGSTVYIYYGNSSADNHEDGNEVFLEFDDFNNSSTISNWTLESNPNTTYSISGGTMSAIASSGDYNSAVIGSTYTDVIVNSRFAVNSSQSHGGFIFRGQNTAADNSYQWIIREGINDNRIQKRLNSAQAYLLGGSAGIALPSTLTAGNWYPIEFKVSGTTIDTYFNNLQAINGDFVDTGFTSGKIGILSYDGSEYFDYFFVRKYATSQPTTSNQSEETGTAPIAYWKFDEGSGTTAYDSAGIDHEIFATGSSSPTWVDESQCISGKCLSFDGNDYLSAPDSPSFDINEHGFTYTAWIKGNNFPDTYNMFMGHHLPYFNVRSSGILHMSMHADGSQRAVSGSTVLNTNTWYFVAATYDSNGYMKVYLNGKLDGTAGPYLNPTNYSYPMFIGKWTPTNSYMFDGFIDEVKIYPYARTADQILQDYNSRGSLSGSSVNLGVQSNTTPSIKSSLVAYYKFDEGSGTSIYNSSDNTKNGTMDSGSSSPSWNNEGHSNKSLSFDGNDSITLANEIVSTSLIRTNGVTYSAWIKPNNVSGIRKIFGQKPSSGYSDLASGGIDISSGKARMIAYDDNIAYKYATGNTTLIVNQWYFITGVYDPSDQKIKIYVNGKFDGGETSITTFNRLLSNDYNLIGSHNHTSSFFSGLIDEVKIYNRALTPDEIKQDYNSGSAIQFGTNTQTIGGTTTSLDYCIPGDASTCSAPVAEWNFEENSGTTIKDTSGNNNDGSFNTGDFAPTWTTGKNNTGAGIKFNGESNSSHISTTYPSSIAPTSYTAEAWVKPYDTTSTLNPSYGYTIFAASIDGSRYPIWTTVRNGEIKTYAFSTSLQTSGANIQANKWYHIAVSATQNGTATIYVNGVGQTSFTAGSSNWDITDKLTIGDLRPNRNISYNGVIDEVKVYDYIRTPAQIAYDYNKGAPVGWWKLDECQGSVANDSSGNGNTGTITIGSSGSQTSLGTCAVGTSAAWTNGATGHTNSSLNFDGVDDKITINDSSSLDVVGAISISFWVKGLNTNSVLRGIFEKSNNSSFFGGYTNISYQVGELNDNKIRFLFNDGTNTGQISTNKTDWNTNTWYHITVTWDGTTNTKGIKTYVNGAIDNQATSPISSIQNTSGTLNIAGKGTSYNFNGQIDDVRIYNYALTSEQVKTVYNNGSVNFN